MTVIPEIASAIIRDLLGSLRPRLGGSRIGGASRLVRDDITMPLGPPAEDDETGIAEP
jgi:hypothetical protein